MNEPPWGAVRDRPKILLVDDRSENLLALRAILASMEVEFREATSGETALEILLEEEHDFAVILLDVRMPGISGLEVGGLVRELDQTRQIPIIFLTAFDETDGFLLEAYSLGAVDFICKPIEPLVLRSKVSIFVELHVANQQIKKQVGALARSNAELERLDQIKDRFVSMVSHEFRSPLGAILGFASLLSASENLPACEKKQAEGILQRGKELLNLVEDLLELQRIEQARDEVRTSEFAFDAVLDDSLESVLPQLEEKGLGLVRRIEESLPSLRTDRGKLGQILTNLLGNAVKFTEVGEVRILAKRVQESLEVRVEDTGVGIADADRERIFDEFRQVCSTESGSRSGAGLGLSISRRLSHLLGGSITVESVVEQGSRFILQIPLNRATVGMTSSGKEEK